MSVAALPIPGLLFELLFKLLFELLWRGIANITTLVSEVLAPQAAVRST
jgi:hypothetical protein